MRRSENGPDWGQVFELALAQDGHFSIAQAEAAGISRPNLQAHLKRGYVLRVHRGVYRFVRYPPGEHEDLAAIWLQSDQEGVFSHETVLALYGLSDVLPARVHITLPPSWRRRKLLDGLVVHFDEVPETERTWFGSVPVTSVRRTLQDCAVAGLSPEHLQQAAIQALERGLVVRSDILDVERTLQPFGGLEP